MPQFDQSSFLNQITWVTIMFTGFYLFATYVLIPNLSANIKFRKKKLETHGNLNEEKLKEIFFQNSIYNAFKRFSYNATIKHLKKIDSVNANTLNNFKTILLKKPAFNNSIITFVTKKFCFPKKYKLSVK